MEGNRISRTRFTSSRLRNLMEAMLRRIAVIPNECEESNVMFDKSVNEFESRRRLKSPFDKGGFRGILLCRRLEIPPTPLFQRGELPKKQTAK
jgi:hypothetical protein